MQQQQQQQQAICTNTTPLSNLRVNRKRMELDHIEDLATEMKASDGINDDVEDLMLPVAIKELHQRAIQEGDRTYIDPETGFMVFTELQHLQRGTCCGNKCRHCPYGWTNVKGEGEEGANTRPSSFVSGDKVATQARVQEILSQAKKKKKNRNNTDNRNNNLKAVTNGKKNGSKTGGRHGGRWTGKNVPYTRGGDKGKSQLLTGEVRSKADAVFEAMGTVDELCSHVGVVHAALLAEQQQQELLQEQERNTSSVVDDPIDYCDLPDWLLEIMSRLFDIGSHVAKPRRRRKSIENDDNDKYNSSDSEEEEKKDSAFEANGIGGGFDYCHVEELEDWIDVMTEQLPELSNFILPTGSSMAAHLHVARTVCRRAERILVPLVVKQSQDNDGGDGGVCDPNALRYLNRLSDFLFVASRWVNFRQGKEEIQYRRPKRGAKQRNRVTVQLQHNDNA